MDREKLTRDGLVDVDAGRAIDQQAVQSWADSFDTNFPLPPPAPRDAHRIIVGTYELR